MKTLPSHTELSRRKKKKICLYCSIRRLHVLGVTVSPPTITDQEIDSTTWHIVFEDYFGIQMHIPRTLLTPYAKRPESNYACPLVIKNKENSQST